MAGKSSPKRRAVLYKFTKLINRHSCCSPCDLNYSSIKRGWVVKRSRAADQAVFSDHCGLDHLALGKINDYRDNSAEREIDRFDRIAGLKQHRFLRKFENLHIWQQRRDFI